jgi:hypothetical protein
MNVQTTIDHLTKTAQYIVKNGELPYKNNKPKRIALHTIYSMACSPCYIWSIIMRVLACPVQCICNGPPYMCSNNYCTNTTDNI